MDYHTLPGLGRAGALLLEAVGLGIERVKHLDLYGCFPIAPRLSAVMLGLAAGDPRPLTVTGALPWFGGPGSNYTTHAVATLADRLRAEPESFALAHALGWNLTKHALAIYAGTPPPKGWQQDRKSTRLNSSHTVISYAVFCLKKKKKKKTKK